MHAWPTHMQENLMTYPDTTPSYTIPKKKSNIENSTAKY